MKSVLSSGKKTIFFTVSSTPSFRNLFFLPGCVFEKILEILKTRDDLRFVFLVPEELFRKFSYRFLPHQSESCAVEGIAVTKKLTTGQRLFRFFYSYLIYTGTTHLLASMGTRPDEMRPGSRFIAPFKMGIAYTFGRSRLVKTRIIPLLFNRIFRERPFGDLFERYAPQGVFLPNLYSWFDTLLAREAAERGIKTLGMVANWDHIDKYFMPFRADRFLAQSAQVKDGAVREQAYRAEDVGLAGYPYFDFVWRKEYVVKRDEFMARWNFPDDAKVLLYISGSSYCPDEPEVIEEILGVMDRGGFPGNTHLIIRPYLGGRFKDKDFDEKKFNKFEEHPAVRMYRRESWSDLGETISYLNIMAHADVVMSGFSTAALEVSLFDRPLISIGFDGYRRRPFHRSVRRFEYFTHFQDVFRIGAVRVVRDFPQLYDAISGYLKNPRLDAERRARMREMMCYKLDGRASDRILGEVIKMID